MDLRHPFHDVIADELGFPPQSAVRWLAPRVLLGTGTKAVLASIFGSYADKRELQGTLPARIHSHGTEDEEEFWLDYIADVGDGFDATYSVATLLGRPELAVAGATEDLPRGSVLVMGGDQVYPAASIRDYENRTKNVYRAAFPSVEGDQPALLALPGNHDWYDGLTAFLRVFAQGRSFGGWRTEQTRSYFAVQLPHRWWLLAVDTQFDDYIDAPQLEYFREVASKLQEGDGVILCTAEPVWVDANTPGGASGYDTVEFFEREIIRPTGAEVRLMLAGDKHHYSRYTDTGDDRQRVTCGLGGAYLTATHELPDEVAMPPEGSRLRSDGRVTRSVRQTRYPRKLQSEVFAAGILRLPWRNPGFMSMIGVTQSLFVVAVLAGLADSLTEGDVEFFSTAATWTPALVIGVLVLIAGRAFARLEILTARWKINLAGTLHALVHLGIGIGYAFLIRWLYSDVLPHNWITDWAVLLLVVAVTPLIIGIVGSEIVALYLMIVSRFGINLNEVMAGQSIEDHKGFLRLRITSDGVTVYPIVLPKVGKHWQADPGRGPSDPVVRPRGFTLRPTLMEPPFTVRRQRPGTGADV